MIQLPSWIIATSEDRFAVDFSNWNPLSQPEPDRINLSPGNLGFPFQLSNEYQSVIIERAQIIQKYLYSDLDIFVFPVYAPVIWIAQQVSSDKSQQPVVHTTPLIVSSYRVISTYCQMIAAATTVDKSAAVEKDIALRIYENTCENIEMYTKRFILQLCGDTDIGATPTSIVGRMIELLKNNQVDFNAACEELIEKTSKLLFAHTCNIITLLETAVFSMYNFASRDWLFRYRFVANVPEFGDIIEQTSTQNGDLLKSYLVSRASYITPETSIISDELIQKYNDIQDNIPCFFGIRANFSLMWLSIMAEQCNKNTQQ
jgi:hypothetical protein